MMAKIVIFHSKSLIFGSLITNYLDSIPTEDFLKLHLWFGRKCLTVNALILSII